MVAPIPWIAQLAAERGMRYEPEADERWLRAWEPYATLKSPIRYEHALSSTGAGGSLTLARFVVNTAADAEASAWIAITQDMRLSARAAATSDRAGAAGSGTTFGDGLDLVGMPRRRTGDAPFDATFASFAPAEEDVTRAIGPSMRKLVMSWRVPLHLEVRKGGFILAPVALAADRQSLDWFVTAIHLFGEKASKLPGPA